MSLSLKVVVSLTVRNEEPSYQQPPFPRALSTISWVFTRVSQRFPSFSAQTSERRVKSMTSAPVFERLVKGYSTVGGTASLVLPLNHGKVRKKRYVFNTRTTEILIDQGAAGFLKGAGRSWVNVVARPAAGESF